MKFLMVFLAATFLFAYDPAMANGLDVQGLTEKQQAEIALKIAKMKSGPETHIQDALEYAQLGKKIGIALVEVAKELGKSVDDVLASTTGKIIVFLIVWKVAGQDLLGILAGTVWFLIMIPLWVVLLKKMVLDLRFSYEYDDNGKVIAKQPTRDMETYGGWSFFFFAILGAICVAGFVMVF